jgi:membrane protease YdiL (CAAX protease family)
VICIFVPWINVALVATVGLLAGRSAASIGLTLRNLSPGQVKFSVIFIVVGALITALMTVAVQFAGPKTIQQFRHKMPRYIASLPHTLNERLLFLGVALTAGICEEILFRGFGIAYLRWLWPGFGDFAIVVITAVLFGLAHYGQGRSTIGFAGVVGCFFAWATLVTGSLIPAMVVHCLIDLRISLLPAALSES